MLLVFSLLGLYQISIHFIHVDLKYVFLFVDIDIFNIMTVKSEYKTWKLFKFETSKNLCIDKNIPFICSINFVYFYFYILSGVPVV